MYYICLTNEKKGKKGYGLKRNNTSLKNNKILRNLIYNIDMTKSERIL